MIKKPDDCVFCPLKVDFSYETMFCPVLRKTLQDGDIKRCPISWKPEEIEQSEAEEQSGLNDFAEGYNAALYDIFGENEENNKD